MKGYRNNYEYIARDNNGGFETFASLDDAIAHARESGSEWYVALYKTISDADDFGDRISETEVVVDTDTRRPVDKFFDDGTRVPLHFFG